MEVQRIKDRDRLTVLIDGMLDSVNSPVLWREVEGYLEDIKTLILDFEKVPYLSSAGVRVILLLLQMMDGKGTVKLVHVNEDIVELFDTIGFLSIIDIEPAPHV